MHTALPVLGLHKYKDSEGAEAIGARLLANVLIEIGAIESLDEVEAKRREKVNVNSQFADT